MIGLIGKSLKSQHMETDTNVIFPAISNALNHQNVSVLVSEKDRPYFWR